MNEEMIYFYLEYFNDLIFFQKEFIIFCMCYFNIQVFEIYQIFLGYFREILFVLSYRRFSFFCVFTVFNIWFFFKFIIKLFYCLDLFFFKIFISLQDLVENKKIVYESYYVFYTLVYFFVYSEFQNIRSFKGQFQFFEFLLCVL